MLTTSVHAPRSAAMASRTGTGSPASHDLQWSTRAVCPPEWSACLERFAGSFFHLPRRLTAGAPAGEPVFAQLLHGDEIIGVAAGVRSDCRLDDPQHGHGLYRFKSGFGAELVPCRSARRALRRAHVASHRVASWIATRLHP